VRPILEYGAACWEPCREGQIYALDRVQTKAAKFANHMSESNWETLSQRKKISRVYALFKAYSGERAWKAIGDRLQGPKYLSRIDHEWKIRNRRQRTNIGKYSFVNRTIRHGNWLPAEILETLPCKPSAFWKRIRRVINVVNWREKEWVVNYLKSVVNWSKVKWSSAVKGVKSGVPWRVFMVGEVKWGEVQWSEVKILLKMVCYTCGLTTVETRYFVVCVCACVCARVCVYEWVL
jgi:hypothetical protein